MIFEGLEEMFDGGTSHTIKHALMGSKDASESKQISSLYIYKHIILVLIVQHLLNPSQANPSCLYPLLLLSQLPQRTLAGSQHGQLLTSPLSLKLPPHPPRWHLHSHRNNSSTLLCGGTEHHAAHYGELLQQLLLDVERGLATTLSRVGHRRL